LYRLRGRSRSWRAGTGCQEGWQEQRGEQANEHSHAAAPRGVGDLTSMTHGSRHVSQRQARVSTKNKNRKSTPHQNAIEL
jgi:hypothetical protein